jgi:hypothetical protein
MVNRMINQAFLPFALALSLAIPAFAQPPATPATPQDPIVTKAAQEQEKKSQLGERQRLVERKMAELETKFTSIAEQIRQKEPERADRLVAAYQRAKETLLKEKMNEVSQLLDQNKFAEAQQGLDQVIVALEDLIRLLIDQKNDQLDKQQEIKMLEQWKKDIKQVQQDQKKQTRETENVANKDDALKKLDAQIKELNELIEAQKKVVEETEANTGKGLKALDKIADQQFDVRKRTEKLTDNIADKPQPADGKSDENAKENPGQPNANSGKAGDSKSGKEKSAEKSADSKSKSEDDPKEKPEKEGDPSKADDAKSGDSKSNDSKSGESKSGDSKSGDSKSGDSKSGDSKSGDSKSGDSKSGDSKSPSKQSESPRPGQQPLEKAQESQRRAEEKLASGKAEDAQRQQQDAIKKMEEAKLELEKEKRRIASLPPEALKQIAENQRRIRDKSMDIAKSMKDAPKPKTDSKNSDASQTPPKQPGQQSMEQAGQSMQKAANELNEQEAEQAQRNQKESEKKLQQALDEIEERLNQLREETREEKLARLEGRFREMLDRQKIASLMTVEADDKRNSFGNLERRDQLVLLRLSNEEAEINELGQQAYDLLLEDGTSVVFPEIVHYLKKDLERASELLGEERTDQLTQMVQREVESSLEELLDALKKSKKKGGGGGGGGGGGKQPLLEKSAELKMLRAAQMRLNRRTKQFDSIKSSRELDADLGKEVKSIAERQAQLLEMAERIMSAEQSDQTP